MSNTKFIISTKNPHKCEPDILYYCAEQTTRGGDTVWDGDPEKAHVFRSMESTAERITKLKAVGNSDLNVWQRIITYEPVDAERFTAIVINNEIRKIIDTLDDKDVDFLVEHANLDLTKVT